MNTIIFTTGQQNQSDNMDEYNFILELKRRKTTGKKLQAGLSFPPPGKYITHRQSIHQNKIDGKSLFINLTSYGNEIPYNQLRVTINTVNK